MDLLEQEKIKRLRDMAAVMVLNALRDIALATSPNATNVQRKDGLIALHWMMRDDLDTPLSYRLCCDVLNISPAAGRAKVASAGELITRPAAERAKPDPQAVTCAECGQTIHANRPAWTWGEQGAGNPFYCTPCRNAGASPVRYDLMRPANRRERCPQLTPEIYNPASSGAFDWTAVFNDLTAAKPNPSPVQDKGDDRTLGLTQAERRRADEILSGSQGVRVWRKPS